MNFRGHLLTNCAVATATCVASKIYFDMTYEYLAAFSVGVLCASIYLSPDLDLGVKTRNSKSTPRRVQSTEYPLHSPANISA